MAKSRSEIDKEMMYRKIMPSAAKKGGNVVDGADESAVTMEAGAAGLMGNIPPVPTAASMAKAIRRPAVSMPVKVEQYGSGQPDGGTGDIEAGCDTRPL